MTLDDILKSFATPTYGREADKRLADRIDRAGNAAGAAGAATRGSLKVLRALKARDAADEKGGYK